MVRTNEAPCAGEFRPGISNIRPAYSSAKPVRASRSGLLLDLQQSPPSIGPNDESEWAIFSDPDEMEPDEEWTGEVEVGIPDWPVDAIHFSTWLFTETWEPGTPIPYGSAPTVGPGCRNGSRCASLGPIAMAFGLCALGANINASVAAFFKDGSFEGILALGQICILPALVLGTLGRRSQIGRRTAAIGRLCGWAVPLPILFIIADAMKSVADLQFRILIVVFPLFGWSLAAILITLVADGMLGTD